MIDLNPLQNPDALWQHSIMIVVSAIIGYLIGYLKIKRKQIKLESKLQKLDSDLNACRLRNASLSNHSHEQKSINPDKANFKADNLKVIEGIDPQVEELLNSSGIYTFQKLSVSNSENLIKILKNSGSKFHVHDPHTWPQQAELANLGLWEQLDELKKELVKGRYS